MVGRLFLSGGGDGKQTFEVDEIFLKDVNNILYIPVAWKNEDFSGCLAWFTSTMSAHKPLRIDMLTDLTQRVDLNKYDAVYVGGGNTYKLLKKIRDSKFDKKLLDYYQSGKVVYGGSAGAIIWGRDIHTSSIGYDSDKNIVGLRDTRGINALSGLDIQCHYRPSQLKVHKEFVEKTGESVIAIPEESALLVENGRLKVIGTKPVFLISSKCAKKYTPGTEVKV